MQEFHNSLFTDITQIILVYTTPKFGTGSLKSILIYANCSFPVPKACFDPLQLFTKQAETSFSLQARLDNVNYGRQKSPEKPHLLAGIALLCFRTPGEV